MIIYGSCHHQFSAKPYGDLGGVALGGGAGGWMPGYGRGNRKTSSRSRKAPAGSGYEIVADLAETVLATRVVYVADREGDLRVLINAAA